MVISSSVLWISWEFWRRIRNKYLIEFSHIWNFKLAALESMIRIVSRNLWQLGLLILCHCHSDLKKMNQITTTAMLSTTWKRFYHGIILPWANWLARECGSEFETCYCISPSFITMSIVELSSQHDREHGFAIFHTIRYVHKIHTHTAWYMWGRI